MDIYECLKLGVDYYDMDSNYIFEIQQYRRTKMMGLPTPGVRIVDLDGNTVDYWDVENDEKIKKEGIV